MAKVLSTEELLPLVDALADARWHSGETLAKAAGITRAALAKRMERLGDWGLVPERRAGRGYRLPAPLERLDRDRIAAALPPAWQAIGLQVVPVLESTNTHAAMLDGRADPQATFAEMQTAGRGRRGRHWQSPFGANLYLSVAWTFPAWPERLTALPLAVGAAAAAWLDQIGVPGVAVKWPNDLWIDGRKLGGILIETRGEGGGSCRAVVGIGLNLSMRAEQAATIEQPWIALDQALPAAPPRNTLAAALLSCLLQALERFQHQGFEPFRPIYARFDAVAGKPVSVIADSPVSGIARGVDAAGALRVQTPAGERRMFVGDVSLRLA